MILLVTAAVGIETMLTYNDLGMCHCVMDWLRFLAAKKQLKKCKCKSVCVSDCP